MVALGCNLWNSLITSSALVKLSTNSHEFWSRPYPCHSTKYCSFLQRPLLLESKILETSHLMSPSGITIGGGGLSWRPAIVSFQYFSSDGMWNTLWIRSDFGNRKRHTRYEILDMTGKGPKNLEASVFEDAVVVTLSWRSKTLSRTLKEGCRCTLWS